MPKAMAKGNATRPTVIPASRSCRKVWRVYHFNAKNDLGRFGLLMDMMLPSFYAHGRTRPASGGTRCSLPGSGPAIDPAPNKQNKTGCLSIIKLYYSGGICRVMPGIVGIGAGETRFSI